MPIGENLEFSDGGRPLETNTKVNLMSVTEPAAEQPHTDPDARLECVRACRRV